MKPVTPVELFKATPKTNCKECGFGTCLAFATRVIVEKKSLDTCPHLEESARAELQERIRTQQEAEIYTKRDLHKVTAQHIRERLEPFDLAEIAPGLGAVFLPQDGEPALRLTYLNRSCTITKRAVRIEGIEGSDHWDDILLYNYVYFRGSAPIRSEWIPIDSIPGHIPKKPELEHGCEEKIAEHFRGRPEALRRAAELLGGTPEEEGAHADLAFSFLPLPRVPFFLLFWDQDTGEDFPARAKVLFDASVTGYLDIESLVFLAEKFADALVEADRSGAGPTG